MASEGKNSQEFRRYRQGLIALYLAVVAMGGALLVASVVWQLIAPRHAASPPGDPEASPISVEEPELEDLLRCHDDLSKLLTRLGETAGELLLAPAAEGRVEIGAVWDERARRWRADYEAIGARCRLSELAAARRGAAYERMASVYRELPAARTTYQRLLEQFDDHSAGELARMRRALDRSREALLRRHSAAPPP